MSENRKEPVVALYDFRAKQKYIYKTNAVKEIIGASNIIADAFDGFLDLLESKGMKINRELNGFSVEKFKKRAESGGLNGEVIYIGGGNLYMAFDNSDSCVRSNRLFSKMLLETTYSLNVVCSFVPLTNDYEADRKAVYAKNEELKNTEPAQSVTSVFPFTAIDRKTSLPLAVERHEADGKSLYSLESSLKLDKYYKMLKTDGGGSTKTFLQSEKHFDSLISEKGKESLLAVIYIDGNAMGDKIKKLMGNTTDYTECVGRMRAFSKEIHETFVEKPLNAIAGKYKSEENNEKLAFRQIIAGGDEITLVCNARAALEIVKTYFDSIIEGNKTRGNQYSACAGIAIFHSHDPFARMYRIAEECCENGKKRNRKNGNNNFYVDFHYCHSVVTNDLDTIRERQEAKYTNRPYLYHANDDKYSDNEHDFSAFENVVKEILDKKIKRSDIKTLGESIFKGNSYFLFELERLSAKYCKKDKESNEIKSFRHITKENKKAVFDVYVVYDLWFREVSPNV